MQPDANCRGDERAGKDVRRLRGRGPCLAARSASGEIFGFLGPERRGQVHHHSHAVRAADADFGHAAR